MYKITKDQINQIVKSLEECPAKFAIPVIDLLRKIVAEQEMKTQDAEK